MQMNFYLVQTQFLSYFQLRLLHDHALSLLGHFRLFFSWVRRPIHRRFVHQHSFDHTAHLLNSLLLPKSIEMKVLRFPNL
jgi:hypothetical protein